MATNRLATLMLVMTLPLAVSGCKILRKDCCPSPGCGAGLCGDPVCGAPVCGDIVKRSCYAGMKWKGNCGPCQGPKWCICTDACGGCSGPCGGGPHCGCEPGCECEPACECEPGCVVDPGCACEGPCSCGSACGPGLGGGCGPLYSLKYSVRALLKGVFGCGGCGGELYWSAWHNDPPRCCDPCDGCGNWVGPSASAAPFGYRAPYHHAFSVAEQGVSDQAKGVIRK